jgi:hypothetical protein
MYWSIFNGLIKNRTTSPYKFDKLRKSEWTAFNEDNEKLLYGKIVWSSDKEFTEKVYDSDDIPKYETKTILNDSFRIIKTKIKAL